MIPSFGFGDVLPPFVGPDATGAQQPRSPYAASPEDMVSAFCVSPERAAILRGLFGFRAELRANGFNHGFQWIDGSFVENCEAVNGRPPGDVDVVSLLHRPVAVRDVDRWVQFVHDRQGTLFNAEWAKATFRCDGYFIDLDAPSQNVARTCAYWVNLFSHQRATFRWKGLVELPFAVDDAAALAMIEERQDAW